MNIELSTFDKNFLKTLPGNEEVLLSDNGTYYTILCDKISAGVVGCVPSKLLDEGFVQIVLTPEFRNKGVLEIAEDMLAQKHNLKKLMATIKEDNIASVLSHKKACFAMIDDKEMKRLKDVGLLKDNEVRLEKKYFKFEAPHPNG